MEANYDICFDRVIAHEGGYANHPADPGGPTNWGVTQTTLSRWRKYPCTAADVKRLTKLEASLIYRSWYWKPVRGDALPAGLDYAVFDCAVNSGPGQAAKFLQRIAGVDVDGVIGEKTLNALAGKRVADLINRYCDARLAFLKSLRTWRSFGKGWSRRIAEVRAFALQMVGAPAQEVAQDLPAPSAEDRSDKALATDVAPSRTGEGRATIAAMAGAIGTASATAVGALTPYADRLEVVGYVCAGLTVLGAVAALAAVFGKAKAGELA